MLDWPPQAACSPTDINRRSFLDANTHVTLWFSLSINIVFVRNSCLCPTGIDVAIGRMSKSRVSKLGHPKPISTQLVPFVVGDI